MEVKSIQQGGTVFNNGGSKGFFYTGESSKTDLDHLNSNESKIQKVTTANDSIQPAVEKIQDQSTQNMVSWRPALSSENSNNRHDLNNNNPLKILKSKSVDLSSEKKQGNESKKVKGLINRNDPSQVSFQEESAWLESLVAEEVVSKKNKDLLQKKSADFRAVGSPMLPIPPSAHAPPPVEKSQYKYQRSKSENVIEDNIVIDKRKRWLEEQIQKTTTTTNVKGKSDVFQDNKKITKPVEISDSSISSINDKETQSHQLLQGDGDCIDGGDKRGNAYKLPSQIRHSKSVDLDVTTQNCIKVIEGPKRLDNYNEITFLKKQNIANDNKRLENGSNCDNIPLNSFQIGLAQNELAENSSIKPHSYNNSSANDIQKTDKEVLASIQSVKDVAKLFQTTASTTETLVNRRSNVNKGNARPKSYHAGVFNKYDWTSRDNISKVVPDSKSDNAASNLNKNKFGSTNNLLSDQAKKIGVTLLASDLENIIFESNVTSTKSESKKSNETNSTNVNYGMKNTRIIEEIAETERREREIREERSKRSTVDVGGDSNKTGLANFLKENEIHV